MWGSERSLISASHLNHSQGYNQICRISIVSNVLILNMERTLQQNIYQEINIRNIIWFAVTAELIVSNGQVLLFNGIANLTGSMKITLLSLHSDHICTIFMNFIHIGLDHRHHLMCSCLKHVCM